MRFQRQWLRRVLHVSYVPTLGPVHPDTLCPELFDDVLAASRTGHVLPFDKDHRWSPHKDHILLAVSRRGGGTVSTWADQHHAAYPLFLSEGLTCLGFTCALAA